MLKNYLKIAWRQLLKNKTYSFINLFGLTIALSVFLIIGLYITNEISYDKHLEDSDRIVRIVREDTETRKPEIAVSPPGLYHAIDGLYPEVEAMTEISTPGRRLLTVNGQPFYAESLINADPQFFDVFSFNILKGDARKALEAPGNIILTQSLANRLFGDTPALGQTITYEDQVELTVAAIVEDPPSNTHFTFDALKSLSTSQRFRYTDGIKWSYFTGGYIYVKLKDVSSISSFRNKLARFDEAAEKPKWETGNRLSIQPLTSIYLGPDLTNEIAPLGNTTYMYLFGSIGILILALACINYMNLSSAKALQRFREVGVRKTFGAQRKQLIAQFLGESALLCLITLPIAIVIAEAILPVINEMLSLQLSLTGSQYIPLLLALPLIVLITGLLSGSYPAFFLSSLKPGNAFTNRQGSIKASSLRKSLVVFQFVAGILLIISTITIYSQLEYVQNKNLEFQKEHIITYEAGMLEDQYPAFKQMLQNESSIVSMTSGPPPGLGYKNMTTAIEDSLTNEKTLLSMLRVDHNYPQTLGLKLKSGRYFSEDRPTDKNNTVLLTEKAVQILNLGEQPLGKTIELSDNDLQVIGVLENYHNASLFSDVQPVAFIYQPEYNWTGIIRLSGGNTQAALSTIKAAWSSFFPSRPFEFRFLDQRIDQMYRKDQKLASLFTGFSIIAVVVACLGLFGLSAYSAERRTKEIGIRKVLGASIGSILSLLSRDFVMLVIISFVIAIPIGSYAIDQWLSNFAYKIEPGPGIFALAGGTAFAIALLTVSWQSIKAAMANPVDSLRNE
ncbi:MAG: FtsX-like permease family protein [Balneolaceae bacterium]|nr:FtsX-like permease family protein [Balneolaceae bacterium]